LQSAAPAALLGQGVANAVLTEDEIEAALLAALLPVAKMLGADTIEREVLDRPQCRCLEMRGNDLWFTFHFAARLHEIEVGVAAMTPAGVERLAIGDVQEWLGDPHEAYMFDQTSFEAACGRVADFALRLIERYRGDPAAARRAIDAIVVGQVSAFQVAEIRGQAEAAWAERDFAEAERLYSGILDHLTAAERKRLAFARKKQS
jgi:hypothetical protein